LPRKWPMGGPLKREEGENQLACISCKDADRNTCFAAKDITNGFRPAAPKATHSSKHPPQPPVRLRSDFQLTRVEGDRISLARWGKSAKRKSLKEVGEAFRHERATCFAARCQIGCRGGRGGDPCSLVDMPAGGSGEN